MSIKSILCAYSGDPAKGSGLRHAIRLAKRHGAHLTGVAKAGGVGFFHRQFSAQLPQQVRDQLDENGARIMADIRARFLAATEAADLGEQSEFIELNPKTDGPVASVARAFDLVVIGHHTATIYEDDYAAHPDLIALRSGRPVLIVPDGYDAAIPRSANVLVAWDGRRAATRAIVSAMPILEEGARVTLLSVGEAPRNAERLVQTLSRHGIQATAQVVETSGDVASTILPFADDHGVDLIVMGAFEHSKFSHDIVGGATTRVLAHARTPLLMAH